MQGFLEAVVARLPRRLRPIAKALVPLAVAVAIAGQDLVIDAAEVDELKVVAAGAVVALLTYLVPNLND